MFAVQRRRGRRPEQGIRGMGSKRKSLEGGRPPGKPPGQSRRVGTATQLFTSQTTRKCNLPKGGRPSKEERQLMWRMNSAGNVYIASLED